MKNQLKTVSLEDKIRLIIPDDVLDKIRYLCKRIPKEEWSGSLFYSYEGSIKNPENMVITVEDILPLDKGTKTFTSTTIDGRLMDFMAVDMNRTSWRMGLIHSHNDMNTYFSGTDMNELRDNSEAHNFYLSLIVNNYGDFCAKVAVLGKSPSRLINRQYFAVGEGNKKYIVKEVSENVEEQTLFIYDCEIESNSEVILVSEEFEGYVNGIIKDAEDKKKVKTKTSETPAKGFNYFDSVEDYESYYDFQEKAYYKNKILS